MIVPLRAFVIAAITLLLAAPPAGAQSQEAEIRRDYEAAAMAFESGDRAAARRNIDVALAAAQTAEGSLPQGLYGDVHFLAARIGAEAGRVDEIGPLLDAAMRAFEAAGAEHDMSFAAAAHLAGLHTAARGRDPEHAAYLFHIAASVFARSDSDEAGEQALRAWDWQLRVREGMHAPQRARVDARIAGSRFGYAGYVELLRRQAADGRGNRPRPRGEGRSFGEPRPPPDAADGMVAALIDVRASGGAAQVRILAELPPGASRGQARREIGRMTFAPGVGADRNHERRNVRTVIFYSSAQPYRR